MPEAKVTFLLNILRAVLSTQPPQSSLTLRVRSEAHPSHEEEQESHKEAQLQVLLQPPQSKYPNLTNI